MNFRRGTVVARSSDRNCAEPALLGIKADMQQRLAADDVESSTNQH